jgi:hypothetical protein
MNKLEKIFAIGGLITGFSLLGLGLCREDKDKYIKYTIMKGAGLISLAVSSGLLLRELAEDNERGYAEKNKSDDIYPR